MSLEQRAEEGDILVAHGVTYFLHAALVAFQQALCGGDAQLLQIHERAVARGLLKATDKIPQAHADSPGRGFERKILVEIVMQPFLRSGDALVTVLRLEWDEPESCLPGARRFDE